MRLSVDNGYVVAEGGRDRATHAVFHAIQVGRRVYVIYDYMEFQHKLPARNLFAYDFAGNEAWRAKDIGCGASDAYTNFVSEEPLAVSNFAGYLCVIDENSGDVIRTQFTK